MVNDVSPADHVALYIPAAAAQIRVELGEQLEAMRFHVDCASAAVII